LNSYRHTLGNKGVDSFGFLDLGGASIQTAFVPANQHYVLSNFFPLVFNGTSEIRLYAKSKNEKMMKES
jgi:Golgi nucleoside diphosphatase